MNELQLLALAEKALHDNGIRGYLFKRTSENSKWQMRYFVLFQNILFYFENDTTVKPAGLIFLEGSYCDKMVTPSTGKNANIGTNLQVRNPGPACTLMAKLCTWPDGPHTASL